MRTVVRDIIDHYLNLFDVKSFYFAMFAPYSKLVGEYKDQLVYRPAYPSFEIKMTDILKGVNVCEYLKGRFEEFHRQMMGKDKGLSPQFEGLAFGFISKMKLVGNKKSWLCLIDFNCSISGKNLDKVRIALKLLKTGPGLIVESGNSYHFYGDATFADYREWKKFYRGGWDKNGIGDAFTWPAPAHQVIGKNWPRMTLQQGFAMLRINQCSPRPLPMRVVERFEGGELWEYPPNGSPCVDKQRVAYLAAMKTFDEAITEEEQDRILDGWPVSGDRAKDIERFCHLPCLCQGKALLCPK